MFANEKLASLDPHFNENCYPSILLTHIYILKDNTREPGP